MPAQAPVRATWNRDRIWRVATLLLVGLAIHLLAPRIVELPPCDIRLGQRMLCRRSWTHRSTLRGWKDPCAVACRSGRS